VNRTTGTDCRLKNRPDLTDNVFEEALLRGLRNGGARLSSRCRRTFHLQPSAGLELLVGRFAIYCFLLVTCQDRGGNDFLALLRGNCADLTPRRNNFRALNNRRSAIFVEHGHQRFTNGELSENLVDL
jgi:hypothetical protein